MLREKRKRQHKSVRSKSMQDELAKLNSMKRNLVEQIKDRMMRIPQIIDPSVPLAKTTVKIRS